MSRNLVIIILDIVWFANLAGWIVAVVCIGEVKSLQDERKLSGVFLGTALIVGVTFTLKRLIVEGKI